MNILVIDGEHMEAEFRAKFGPGHAYEFISQKPVTLSDDENEPGYNPIDAGLDRALIQADVAFAYGYCHEAVEVPGLMLFVEASKKTAFTSIYGGETHQTPTASDPCPATVFGFCGLPTLLNRPLLEVSLSDEADAPGLAATCAALGTDYRTVADRVGLVTPRVVCMIINEACYTVQEGTATIPDVDLSMKLGTNYPQGPFAWANAIGVERVYDVLEAMWNDTHDERYKICPLLKRYALRGEPFAI